MSEEYWTFNLKLSNKKSEDRWHFYENAQNVNVISRGTQQDRKGFCILLCRLLILPKLNTSKKPKELYRYLGNL